MLTPFLPISAPVDARGTSILNSFDSLERWVGGPPPKSTGGAPAPATPLPLPPSPAPPSATRHRKAHINDEASDARGRTLASPGRRASKHSTPKRPATSARALCQALQRQLAAQFKACRFEISTRTRTTPTTTAAHGTHLQKNRPPAVWRRSLVMHRRPCRLHARASSNPVRHIQHDTQTSAPATGAAAQRAEKHTAGPLTSMALHASTTLSSGLMALCTCPLV
jgi:hypothetical protein